MLAAGMYCGLQSSSWNWAIAVNITLVSQPVSEFMRAFCMQVVWSYTRGDELSSADTNSPEGSCCLRCAEHGRSKNGRGFVCHVDTTAEYNTPATELSPPPSPKCTGKYCLAVAEVSGKRLFYKCLYIFQTFFVHMYLFIMLLLQNSTY